MYLIMSNLDKSTCDEHFSCHAAWVLFFTLTVIKIGIEALKEMVEVDKVFRVSDDEESEE